MIRQICSIKPADVATVRYSKLLAKLELEDLPSFFERRFRWFGHVVQSEQHVIYKLMAGWVGREDQGYMQETNGGLLCVEAHDS